MLPHDFMSRLVVYVIPPLGWIRLGFFVGNPLLVGAGLFCAGCLNMSDLCGNNKALITTLAHAVRDCAANSAPLLTQRADDIIALLTRRVHWPGIHSVR